MGWSSIGDESGLLLWLAWAWRATRVYHSGLQSRAALSSLKLKAELGHSKGCGLQVIGPLQVTGPHSGDSEPQFPLVFSSKISHVALLPWNSQRYTCLCFPSAGIQGVNQAQLFPRCLRKVIA